VFSAAPWPNGFLFTTCATTVIAEREQNPFTLKETIESLDADWDSTAEVLNQADAMRMLLSMW
jgi:hypothetical protein